MNLPPALIQRYLLHLEETLLQVRALQARLASEAGPPAEVVEELKSIAHKLAGTAEAYGFAPLGLSARALQEAARQGVSGSDALGSCTADFRSELERALSRPPS